MADFTCQECGVGLRGVRIGPPEFLDYSPILCPNCGPRCERCGHYVHAAYDCMWDGCSADHGIAPAIDDPEESLGFV